MKQASRLYDFSIANAVIVILAYLVLICLFAGVAASMDNPVLCLIALVVLIISFLALFWYFVGKAPVLTDEKVSQGKRSIDKSKVACEVFYNTRYREMTIRFYDKHKPDAKDKADCITVQATKRNLKKLENWLGYAPEIPEKSLRK